MATPKLQTTREQRAASEMTILPKLPDGRNVIIAVGSSKSYSDSIKLTSDSYCSCPDRRFQKADNRFDCKHMIRLKESEGK